VNFSARQHRSQTNEERCERKINYAVDLLDIKRRHENAGWHRAAL